ncbi:MAG: TldD/PmbA family protein [Erysipelotrichaceae bacterium]|nr:TldD/PmbA family protein [Erysipelotrichaceae bacterium]
MLDKFLKSRIPDARKLVKELSKSYDYVSVLGAFVNTRQISVSTRINSQDDVDNECGFVIKVYKDGRYSEYSCNDIRDLKAATVKKAVKLDKIVSADFSVKMLEEEEHVEDYLREDPSDLSNKEIFDRLTAVKDQIHGKDERVINVFCRYVKRQTSKIFVSSKKCLSQKYDWINVMTYIVVRDGDNIKSNYESQGEADSEIALKKFENEADDVLDIAVKMLDAKPVKPGKYTIITDPSISGLIAHEAFGHGVEMDMFVKNRAKAKDFVGKYVASKLVDMYDGAASCLSAASYFFDDDGVEAHNTQIIKKGILQTGISDCLSAMELGTVPTGNGRRQDFSRKVYTRMTNTWFGKGEDKLEDMIKSVKHGYYLCQTNNGMEDPKNWQIQCTASYGLEIKDGKFTGKMVAPVVISGYVIDLLSSISMVSDEVKVIGSGMCGKGHKEWVYVSDGGPYLKAEAKLG